MTKVLARTLFGLVAIPVVLIGLVLIQSVSPCHNRQIDSNTFVFPKTIEGTKFDLDSLKGIVGEDKSYPVEYELPALLAYAAYPELAHTKIAMELRNHGAPMEANFRLWSLLLPREHRQYVIYLNDGQNTGLDLILLRSLPLDAQVGILAHELGHVTYYHQHNILELGKWGVQYLINDAFAIEHERSTDLIPIDHGLGHQIYRYAHFVRRDSTCREWYEHYAKGFMDTYYRTDEEILSVLEVHELYQ